MNAGDYFFCCPISEHKHTRKRTTKLIVVVVIEAQAFIFNLCNDNIAVNFNACVSASVCVLIGSQNKKGLTFFLISNKIHLK